MAKYTIKQYRQKLKTFEKRLSEYVSYEGRVYNQKYNEFQERIERMERMIKNRTYTQLELNNMMRSLDKARVTDYVVQYDPTKDKFVSPVYTPVFNKRKDKNVPSIHEAKREATEAFNKWLPEEPEDTPKPPPEEPEDEGEGGGGGDWWGQLYREILAYLTKNVPHGLAKELFDKMLLIYDDREKIQRFEDICYEHGLDILPVDSRILLAQISVMNIVLGEKATGIDPSNAYYDEEDFTL